MKQEIRVLPLLLVLCSVNSQDQNDSSNGVVKKNVSSASVERTSVHLSHDFILLPPSSDTDYDIFEELTSPESSVTNPSSSTAISTSILETNETFLNTIKSTLNNAFLVSNTAITDTPSNHSRVLKGLPKFPGPIGSIHNYKPAPSGGEDINKDWLFKPKQNSSGASSNNISFLKGTIGLTGLTHELISAFPGTSGNIFDSKPLESVPLCTTKLCSLAKSTSFDDTGRGCYSGFQCKIQNPSHQSETITGKLHDTNRVSNEFRNCQTAACHKQPVANTNSGIRASDVYHDKTELKESVINPDLLRIIKILPGKHGNINHSKHIQTVRTSDNQSNIGATSSTCIATSNFQYPFHKSLGSQCKDQNLHNGAVPIIPVKVISGRYHLEDLIPRSKGAITGKRVQKPNPNWDIKSENGFTLKVLNKLYSNHNGVIFGPGTGSLPIEKSNFELSETADGN